MRNFIITKTKNMAIDLAYRVFPTLDHFVSGEHKPSLHQRQLWNNKMPVSDRYFFSTLVKHVILNIVIFIYTI